MIQNIVINSATKTTGNLTLSNDPWFDFPSSPLQSGGGKNDELVSALGYVSKMLSVDPETARAMLLKNNPAAHSYFRYSLGESLSQYLGSLGEIFQRIYIHGSCVTGKATASSDIDLIVLVAKKIDPILPYLAHLNALLTTRYCSLMEEKPERLTRLLDIKIVDDLDLDKRRGYASVITSLHNPPILLWEAESVQAASTSSRND